VPQRGPNPPDFPDFSYYTHRVEIYLRYNQRMLAKLLHDPEANLNAVYDLACRTAHWARVLLRESDP
jgi:hypothetical protein